MTPPGVRSMPVGRRFSLRPFGGFFHFGNNHRATGSSPTLRGLDYPCARRGLENQSDRDAPDVLTL